MAPLQFSCSWMQQLCIERTPAPPLPCLPPSASSRLRRHAPLPPCRVLRQSLAPPLRLCPFLDAELAKLRRLDLRPASVVPSLPFPPPSFCLTSLCLSSSGTGTRRAQLRPRRRASPRPSHRAAPVQPLLELVDPPLPAPADPASSPRCRIVPCVCLARSSLYARGTSASPALTSPLAKPPSRPSTSSSSSPRTPPGQAPLAAVHRRNTPAPSSLSASSASSEGSARVDRVARHQLPGQARPFAACPASSPPNWAWPMVSSIQCPLMCTVGPARFGPYVFFFLLQI